MRNSASRASKKSFDWKKAVFNRDEYKCQNCGSMKNLTAHHIVEWDKNVDLRFELSNGQTLCSSCHRAEHNRRMINPKKGKKVSEETRLKMSASQKGHYVSDESKAKMRKAKLGKPSPRKGIKTGKPSLLRGKPISKETKLKLSLSMSGRKLTEEHRLKVIASLEKNRNNPEFIIAHKERWKGKTWKIDPISGKRIWII